MRPTLSELDKRNRRRESDRRWRAANLEKRREADRLRYWANPEKRRENARRWGKNNPEKRRVKARSWCRTNPTSVLLSNARARAKASGLEFSLSPVDIRIPETCPVFGFPLVKAAGDCGPSLDRIDSEKGYIPGNVWVISARANRIKNNATLTELRQLVRALEDKCLAGN